MEISTMAITPTLETRLLFQDNFNSGLGTNWIWPVFPNVPSFNGDTQMVQALPNESDGAVNLQVDTFNPTNQAGNIAFSGTEIYTTQSFSPGANGIAIEFRAKLNTSVPGMVLGLFMYNYPASTSTTSHDELDFEVLSNDASSGTTLGDTNIYDDQPNGVGSPATISGFDPTQYHTYRMEWLPTGEVRWFVDGQLVRDTIATVPLTPMQAHLNFYVPSSAFFAAAYSPNLTPVATGPGTQYTASVDYVHVAALGTGPATAIIDQMSSDEQIELLYTGYFNRAADPAGFVYWEGQDTSSQLAGQSADSVLTTIANSFALQKEAAAQYPYLAAPLGASQVNVTQFVDSVYQNMFDHAPDNAGAAYWVNQLVTGSVSPGSAILAIANGAQGVDATTLTGRIQSALQQTEAQPTSAITSAMNGQGS
jgi:hypothetical protein